MATTSTLTRVVAVVDPGPTQQQIQAALASNDEFQLVDILSSTEKLVRDVRASEPDRILVDHQLSGQPTLDIIDDLVLQYPKIHRHRDQAEDQHLAVTGRAAARPWAVRTRGRAAPA